jgi:hypothetical protein
MISISEVSAVYTCSEKPQTESFRVDHVPAKRFFGAVRSYLRATADYRDDPFWLPLTRQLKRWRFDIGATPLPLKDLVDEVSVASLSQRYEAATRLYPAMQPVLEEVVRHAAELSSCTDAPLVDRLRTCFNTGEESAHLCMAETRLMPKVRKHLDAVALHEIRLLSPAQLRNVQTFGVLALIGSLRWYPAYLFSAPRAPKLVVIAYSWLSIKPPALTKFDARGEVQPNRESSLASQLNRSAESREYQFDDDFQNSTLEDATSFVSRALNPHIIEGETTHARAILLEGDVVVFLDADEGSSAIVIDLAEKGKRRVHRVPIGELQIGTFLLVREEGGGDYVIPVADQLLGNRAAELRRKQLEWKHLLSQRVISHGVDQTSHQLMELGGHRARPVNVRRWIWQRSIRPNDEADFVAIMSLVGRAPDARSYWDAMGLIDRAHMRAGQIIRRLLLAKVHESNLESLEQLGRMKFRLPDAGAGNLVALRVMAISSTITAIPATRLGQLLDGGTLQWLE